MISSEPDKRPARRTRPPLGRARLEEMALAYVARFATSAGKLEGYLKRKLRERGWDEGEGEAPDLADLVARFVARGWVDDAGWGRMRKGSLLARGYGAQRIEADLRAGGLTEDLRADLAPDEAASRGAALAQARRKRLGPFGAAPPADPALRSKLRQKQLAAMLRAGHDFAAASRVVGAATVEELEQWVADANAGEET